MNRYKKTVFLSLLTVGVAYQNISAGESGGASAGEESTPSYQITLIMTKGEREEITVPEGTTYKQFMKMVSHLHPKKIETEDVDGNRIDISKQRVYQANPEWMNWTEKLIVQPSYTMMDQDRRERQQRQTRDEILAENNSFYTE